MTTPLLAIISKNHQCIYVIYELFNIFLEIMALIKYTWRILSKYYLCSHQHIFSPLPLVYKYQKMTDPSILYYGRKSAITIFNLIIIIFKCIILNTMMRKWNSSDRELLTSACLWLPPRPPFQQMSTYYKCPYGSQYLNAPKNIWIILVIFWNLFNTRHLCLLFTHTAIYNRIDVKINYFNFLIFYDHIYVSKLSIIYNIIVCI